MDAIYELLIVASVALISIVLGLLRHFIKEHNKLKIGEKTPKTGLIAVILEDCKTSCGAILVHSGCIVKIADNFIDNDGEVKIYENIYKEMSLDLIWVSFKLLRPADEKERKGYYEGIRNIAALPC